MNSSGISKLAGTLQKRMHDVSNHDRTLYLELGRITAKRGLKLDSFPEEIPKGDYLVCQSLKMSDIKTEKTDNHVHEIKMESANLLESGCRVLVGWANSEPVVIDVIAV